MAQRTLEVATSFRENGQRNGMETTVVIALEKMEGGLRTLMDALQTGSLHMLTVGLFDLRSAIDEYAWASGVSGWDPAYIERVRDLSRVVAGIEHNLESSLHILRVNGEL
jgi:hypothetical protein